MDALASPVHAVRGLLITLTLAWAASDAGAQPLTLDDAVARAGAQSPELRAGQARLDGEAGRRTSARAWFPSNPRVEVGVITDAIFRGQGEGSFDVRFEQELELFGQRGRRIAVVDSEIAGLGFELAAVRLQVRAQATAAYAELRFQEQRVTALTDAVDQVARLDDAAQRRSTAGDIGDAERVLIHADLVSARAEARSAAAERTAAQARLNRLIGLPPDAATTTVGDLPTGPPPAALDELLRTARERRPELRAGAQRVTTADREIELRRRERLPNPTIAIGYSRDRSVFTGADVQPAGAFTRLADADSLFAVSVVVPIPVFRTGRGEIDTARARRAEAAAELEGLRASIDATVAAARAHYDEARQRALDLQAVATELATTLELYEHAYTGGKLDLLAFLVVRDRGLRAQVAALTARHDAAIALGELELATGGTLDTTP